jgi:hypothetical protein
MMSFFIFFLLPPLPKAKNVPNFSPVDRRRIEEKEKPAVLDLGQMIDRGVTKKNPPALPSPGRERQGEEKSSS